MVTASRPPRRFRFGEFILSPGRRSLRRHGYEVPLIPRYLDLLLLLVERRSEALRRQEIFDRVWSDVVVSDGALTQAVRTLRRTLGEDRVGGVFIRTVSRHGYQFVSPVTEEEDVEELSSSVSPTPGRPAPPPPGRAPGMSPAKTASGDLRGAEADAGSDPFALLLARLQANDIAEDERREAAEELHRLSTAEALGRLGRGAGRARAWALLRDTRWDVAGAAAVPLLGPASGPASWLALADLRLRRAFRLVGARWAAACAGGALAGLVAGLLGGLLITHLQGRGWPPFSLLLGLGVVGAVMAGLGAAGVGSGLAAAEALVRSRRTPALVVFGAAGGAAVGAVARHGADALVEAFFATPALGLAGGVEGLVIGAAAGLGYGLSTRRLAGGMASPRGAARLGTCLAAGVACALAAGILCAGGFRLGAASLRSVVAGFPNTQVRLEVFAPLVGETAFGPRTRAALGAAEGLLFGVGLAAGLTRRPRRRDDPLS